MSAVAAKYMPAVATGDVSPGATSDMSHDATRDTSLVAMRAMFLFFASVSLECLLVIDETPY